MNPVPLQVRHFTFLSSSEYDDCRGIGNIFFLLGSVAYLMRSNTLNIRKVQEMTISSMIPARTMIMTGSMVVTNASAAVSTSFRRTLLLLKHFGECPSFFTCRNHLFEAAVGTQHILLGFRYCFPAATSLEMLSTRHRQTTLPLVSPVMSLDDGVHLRIVYLEKVLEKRANNFWKICRR